MCENITENKVYENNIARLTGDKFEANEITDDELSKKIGYNLKVPEEIDSGYKLEFITIATDYKLKEPESDENPFTRVELHYFNVGDYRCIYDNQIGLSWVDDKFYVRMQADIKSEEDVKDIVMNFIDYQKD